MDKDILIACCCCGKVWFDWDQKNPYECRFCGNIIEFMIEEEEDDDQ